MSLLWVLRAYAAAAELAGVRPSRSPAVVVAGWLVPVANLLIPGSTLAEIEHAALGRPAARRPTPSVLLMAWWASWVAGVLLAFAVPVIRSDRAGGPDAGPGLAEHFEHRFRPLSAGSAVPVFAFLFAGVTVGGRPGLPTSVTDRVAVGSLVATTRSTSFSWRRRPARP